MTEASETRFIAGCLVVGAVLLVVLWFTGIAPKRADNAGVHDQLAGQQQRLGAARAQIADRAASRKRFPGLLVELRLLDRAVPVRGEVSKLLRELQRRARVRASDLRLVALKDPGGGGAPSSTPGATSGPGGLAALPFTISYSGRYFDLLQILAAVRDTVRVRSGDLDVGGRLLTIDGLTFKRADSGDALTSAVINATAYIAPDDADASPKIPSADGPAADSAAPAAGSSAAPAPAAAVVAPPTGGK